MAKKKADAASIPGVRLDQLRLRDAQFVECAITNRDGDPLTADELYDCEFSYAIGHLHNLEDHIVGIELRLSLDGIDEEKKPVGVHGHFWLRFTFEVLNMEELLAASKTAEPSLPPPLYLVLLGIAYSTARGLVMAKTAGTVLQGITLPIVDVRQLVEGSTHEEKASEDIGKPSPDLHQPSSN